MAPVDRLFTGLMEVKLHEWKPDTASRHRAALIDVDLDAVAVVNDVKSCPPVAEDQRRKLLVRRRFCANVDRRLRLPGDANLAPMCRTARSRISPMVGGLARSR